MRQPPYRHLLCATDGWSRSEQAARHAVELAAALGARLTLLHVLDPAEYAGREGTIAEEEILDAAFAEARALVHAARRRAQLAGVECALALVLHHQPYQAILERADALSADLIVMASHGRRGLEAVLLGSETQKVITHGRLPVLVVRSGTPPQAIP
jgi:nucleotide-binding universal stress UspA family protein